MDILFIDRSTALKTVEDLRIKPRGGMVSSLFKVTNYLSQFHNVVVYAGIDEPGFTIHGVEWTNERPRRQFDVIVLNRGIGNGYPEYETRKRILWTHDLPHNGFAPEPKNLSAFTTVFMSKYAERIWRKFYPSINRSVYIPNGVDKDLFYPREKGDYLIYCSHPNRGLRKLPLIHDSLNARLDTRVSIKAFSNTDMYPLDQDSRDHGDEVDIDYQSDFKVLKPVPQNILAEEMGRAAGMIMPTGYPEICSNNVLQTIASGTPLITTGNLGSVGEWVKHGYNGLLTEFMPNDYMVHTVEIVRHCVEFFENRRLREKLQKNCSKVKIHTWDEIGEKWRRLLNSI